ncbi:MAG: hypothetical protein ACLGPM_09375 [Acidobacteriota bacterium]
MSRPSLYPECRHLLTSGRKCRAAALQGKAYCSAHLRQRNLVEANRVRRHSVALPPLDDRTAIQMSLDEILAAFAAHKISRREAGTYLFALQIGELNLTRMEQLPPPDPETSGDHDSTGAQAPAAPPQVAGCPRSRAADLGEHDSMGAPTPSAPPQVAAPQVPDCLPDHHNTEATHEHDPERPFPLTAKKLRQRRKSLEESLRGCREAHAFYAAMPQDDPNQRPPVVLAYLEKNMAKAESELRFLNEQSVPDPP